jgi:cytochrome c-type biogenesis protein CcmF
LIMVFGGIVSIMDRRYRIGAPARKPRPAAPETVPAE